MSNPLMAPTVDLDKLNDLQAPPLAYLRNSPKYYEGYADMIRKSASTGVVQQSLYGADIGKALSVAIPRQLTRDERLLATKPANARTKPLLAYSKQGSGIFANSSTYAREWRKAVWIPMPDETRARVRPYCERYMHIDAGAEMTLGRVGQYLPRRGSVLTRAPKRAEVKDSLARMGYRPPAEASAWQPMPLRPLEEGGECVKINQHANNGWPVSSKMSDPEAAEMVVAIANDLRARLEALPRGDDGRAIRSFFLNMIEKEPYLVVQRGACKTEVVDVDKYFDRKLRYYVQQGAQHKLIIKPATSRFSKFFVNVFTEEGCQAFQGGTLTYGGHAELIQRMQDELDRQLESSDFGYTAVFNGDDSLCALAQRLPDSKVRYHIYDGDVSSMDISTHKALKAPICLELAREMQRIDYVGAWWWYSTFMTRLMSVSGVTNIVTGHGTPSGNELVTLVNGVAINVLSTRAAEQLRVLAQGTEIGRQLINDCIVRCGEALSLPVRTEQYATSTMSLFHCFSDNPITFLGYEIEFNGLGMNVVRDLGRMMGSVMYPPRQIKSADEFAVSEAIRLASITLGAGGATSYFPMECVEAMYLAATNLVLDTLEKIPPGSYADGDDPGVQLVVGKLPGSRLGLLPHLLRGPRRLWPNGLNDRPFSLGEEVERRAEPFKKLMLNPALVPAPPSSGILPEASEYLTEALGALDLDEGDSEETSDDELRVPRGSSAAAAAQDVDDIERMMLAGARKQAADTKRQAAATVVAQSGFILPETSRRLGYQFAYPLNSGVSADNWGRPPPTARYGPDKSPRRREHEPDADERWDGVRESVRHQYEAPPDADFAADESHDRRGKRMDDREIDDYLDREMDKVAHVHAEARGVRGGVKLPTPKQAPKRKG